MIVVLLLASIMAIAIFLIQTAKRVDRLESRQETILMLERDWIERNNKLERRIETNERHTRHELGGIKKVVRAMNKKREGIN